MTLCKLPHVYIIFILVLNMRSLLYWQEDIDYVETNQLLLGEEKRRHLFQQKSHTLDIVIYALKKGACSENVHRVMFYGQ